MTDVNFEVAESGPSTFFVVENPPKKQTGLKIELSERYKEICAFLNANPNTWVKLPNPEYNSIGATLKKSLERRNPGKLYQTTSRVASRVLNPDTGKYQEKHWVYLRHVKVD